MSYLYHLLDFYTNTDRTDAAVSITEEIQSIKEVTIEVTMYITLTGAYDGYLGSVWLAGDSGPATYHTAEEALTAAAEPWLPGQRLKEIRTQQASFTAVEAIPSCLLRRTPRFRLYFEGADGHPSELMREVFRLG